MAKKSGKVRRKSSSRGGFWASEAGKKTVVVLLVVIAFAGLVAVIKGFPDRGPGANYGVGADGFRVYEMKGVDLGIADVVKKPVVEAELGGIAKEVEDVLKSGVINYNGAKGQTATYYFTSKDGIRSSVYVDVMEYPNKKAYDEADVFIGTLDAGKVQNLQARYMKAATIANEREYALLVSKGIKSYKFAMVQPYKNVTISEKDSRAILKKIADKAEL